VPTAAELASDLADEHAELDVVLEGLQPDQWALPTDSPGWSVADQVGHLTYFDGTAALAIRDAEAFKVHASQMFAEMAAGTNNTLSAARNATPAEVLELWRANRADLIAQAATLDDKTRLAWYGPDMGAKSFLTARLMEAWAHGNDVCQAVDVGRTPTDRLRHIAQLGVITRSWSYMNRGLDINETPVQVTLAAPSGAEWTWGDGDANESVVGSAEAFCRVVTQRSHVDDTDLVVSGDAATEWMKLAQAFAGGATDGPTPRGDA